uniref:Macaca fascicularis brain cDNA clone: QmoA-10906, similar to human absent in melanoma 1 (AIM1), mRNA, RefSeq: XM_166300.4 n=1 Tax=Macaca fascicularis TaxID=9541 RepID=I7GJ27_MACFA|nr:unnamed protein product [Macaca fascicularis]
MLAVLLQAIYEAQVFRLTGSAADPSQAARHPRKVQSTTSRGEQKEASFGETWHSIHYRKEKEQ